MVPKFTPGQSVKSRSTEQRGKVVLNTLVDDRWVVIVDIPHGQATLRQHFAEPDLELIPDSRSAQ
mgnify:CR=1 FL=1